MLCVSLHGTPSPIVQLPAAIFDPIPAAAAHTDPKNLVILSPVMGFPMLKLPTVVLDNVFKFCSIDDLLLLSTLSKKTKNTIKNVRSWPKEVLRVKLDSFKVRIQHYSLIEWKFEKGQDVITNPTFLEMIQSAGDNGGTFVCAEPRATLTLAFAKIMDLFKIDHITELNAFVTPQTLSLQSDEILRGMRTCNYLHLSLSHPVTNDDLDWLFERITVQNAFTIKAETAGMYQYQRPFSTADTVFYAGRMNVHTFDYNNLVNAKRIHMINVPGYTASQLNSFLRVWQQGLLPNLQVMEHGGLMVTGHPDFMTTALEGLDAEDWDVSRERNFNQTAFHFYANLRFFTRELRFRESKDITRTTDGVKASIIPVSARHSHLFAFVVWSDWIPAMYRRPSRTPYEPVNFALM